MAMGMAQPIILPALPAGGTVRFGLKPHKVLLFAKDTGERIRFGEARNG